MAYVQMRKYVPFHGICVRDSRVGVRQCQKHRLLCDFLTDCVRQLIPENGDHKVHAAFPVHAGQVSQVSIPEDHIYIRILLHKALQSLRHNGDCPALLDPHTDSRMAFMQFILHQPVKLSLQLQHFLRPHHVLFPDRSQYKRFASSGPLKQPDSQIFFHVADIDTQRRGRDKKLLRRPGKTLAARQGTYILLLL